MIAVDWSGIYRPLRLFETAGAIVELGPLGESSTIIGLIAGIAVGATLRIAARKECFALVDAPLPVGHIEQHLPNFMRGEAKKVLDGRRVGFIDGLHQSQPGFMHDAIDVVSRLQAWKRAEHDLGRQSAEPGADLFEKLPAGRFVPPTEAVEQRLKLKRGILVHTARRTATDCTPDSCGKSSFLLSDGTPSPAELIRSRW